MTLLLYWSHLAHSYFAALNNVPTDRHRNFKFYADGQHPNGAGQRSGTIKSTILLWLLYKWYARHRSEYFTTFGRWHSHSLSKGETHEDSWL